MEDKNGGNNCDQSWLGTAVVAILVICMAVAVGFGFIIS